MKNLKILTLLVLLTLGGCNKDCESEIAACNDTPPTNELCAAAFNRWFFDSEENKCTQIAYSGCSQKGFETEQACEECQCE